MRKLLYILLIILSVGKASAQTYSFTQQANGTLTVMPVVFMSLTTTGGIPAFTTEAHYDNGVTNTNYANAYVKANLPWIINVRAQNATWTPLTTGGSTTMPCSVLKVKKSTNSTYVTLSTTNQTLTTGPLGPNTVSGNTFNIAMQFTPGWSYAGGTYRLNVIYTASQQ